MRAERTAAHARHLRAHVDRLAAKAYWQQFPSAPEFVVLFVPGEAFLGPALEADPALLEHAYARRVHLATPTTLVTLLRAVAHGWQQRRWPTTRRRCSTPGAQLYGRLATLGTHVDKLGRSLTAAVAAYNATVGSLERLAAPERPADGRPRDHRRRAVRTGGEVDDVAKPVTAPALLETVGPAGRASLSRRRSPCRLVDAHRGRRAARLRLTSARRLGHCASAA